VGILYVYVYVTVTPKVESTPTQYPLPGFMGATNH
jgi:hypothetical protein